MTKLSLLLFISTMLVTGDCASRDEYYYSRIEGTVKEQTTAAPIPGVHILVSWQAHFGTHAITSACTWIATAETDAQGRFSIAVPPSRMTVSNKKLVREMRGGYPTVRLYKTGMTAASTGMNRNGIETSDNGKALRDSTFPFLPSRTFEITTTVNGTLRASAQDSHGRVRELLKLSRPFPDCENFHDPVQIKRFHEAIGSEAKTVASSAYERALSDVIEARATSPVGANAKFYHVPDVLPGAKFDPDSSDDNRNKDDHTALMKASANGDANKVEALLRAGANPNRTSFMGQGSYQGYSALTLAIEGYGRRAIAAPASGADYVRVIELLLSGKATDTELRENPQSHTALMAAVSDSQDDVVALLLGAGANPNIELFSESLLFGAEDRSLGNRSSSALKTYDLILHSQSLHPRQKERALIRAAGSGKVERVRKIMSAGVDANAQGDGMWTPLICATEHAIMSRGSPGYVDVVKEIATVKGLNKALTYKGKTAFEMAKSAGHSDLMEILR